MEAYNIFEYLFHYLTTFIMNFFPLIPNQNFPWCHMSILNTRISKGKGLKNKEYANSITLINMSDEYSLTHMHK